MRLLQTKLVILFLIVLLSTAHSEETLCDLKTYYLLKNPPTRNILSLSATMLDFFNFMNNTDYENAIYVWQRFATYQRSPFMARFINLTANSFQVGQMYDFLVPLEDSQSFDFNTTCVDLCADQTTYTVAFRTTSFAASIAKPGIPSFNNTLICNNPDNLFCQLDPSFLGPYSQFLIDDLERYPLQMTPDGRSLMVYTKYTGGDVEYCFTVDGRTKLISHACNDLQDYMHAYNAGMMLSEFTDTQKDILTSQVDAQLQIDYLYILSHSKFGDYLGRIYNDCKRYGPL